MVVWILFPWFCQSGARLPRCVVQPGMLLPFSADISIYYSAQYVLINAGLIIYTGVNPGLPWEPCIYLVVAHYCYLVWLAPRGYEGIADFPQRSLTLPIFHFLVFYMPLIFLLCAVCFSGCSCTCTHGTQRFSDWPELCRAVQRDPRIARCIPCAMTDAPPRSPPYYWFLTGSARRIPGRPFLMPAITVFVLEAQYLWRPGSIMGPRWRRCWWDLQQGLQMAGVPNKFPAHCPVRFSLLLSLVVPLVCIVTKS